MAGKKPAAPKVAAPKVMTLPASGKTVGLPGLKGVIGGHGFIAEEPLSELRGQRGIRVFQEMETDPICGGIIWAFEQLIRNVDWRVEVNANAKNATDAEHAKEFVTSVLFDDMRTSFGTVVNEILSFLPYGFALQEIIPKVRRGETGDVHTTSKYDDGYIGLSALSPRAQHTIYRWVYDSQETLLGVEQHLLNRHVVIPMHRLLHHRTTSRYANPEGRSIFRSAYKPWVRKEVLEQAEGKLAVRSSGVAELRIPAALMDPNAGEEEKRSYQAYQEVAKQLSQDQSGYIILPSDVDLDSKAKLFELNFAVPDSKHQKDTSAPIERYGRQMAMSVLADFIMMGHEAVGSLALSKSKTNIFAKALSGTLGLIAEPFNRMLIPQLWQWNGFDYDCIPTLVVPDVEEVDLSALGGFLGTLAALGIDLSDEATVGHLRQQAGLPGFGDEASGGDTVSDPDKKKDTSAPDDDEASEA